MTSAPVEKMAIFGRLYTLTLVLPSAAKTPISKGPSICSLRRTVSPFRMSDPALMTFFPLETEVSIRTVFSSWKVYSHMTTASAPSGRGAPVTISAVEPFFIETLGDSPILTCPESFKARGCSSSAPNVSAALTA